MHNRFVLPKVILMTVVAIALIAIPTLTLADSRDNLKSNTGEQTQNLKMNEQEVSGLKKLVRYQRSTYLWPYATGPYYGDAPANLMHTPHWLRTMVGSFDTSNPVFNLPGELRKDLSSLSQTGMQYFIVQFDPDAFDNGKLQNLRKEFEGMGVQFFDYLPNRAFIVLLNAANYAIVSSSSAMKFMEPYHPAFKISPQVGRYPLLDPVKAVSPIYSLDVMVFPNESAELVAMQISKMGGFVKTVAGDTINVDIDRSQLGNIAKLEAVRAIYENIQIVLHGEETTSTMQVGNNSGPDMAIPYFDVGVDGGGADFDADGTKEIAPQKLQVIDSGISLDAKDLSHTDSVPGTAGSSHRKVFKYISTSGFPGGSGDDQSCDDPINGSYTHGHVVSCTALGNASDVPPGYGDPEFFYDEYDNPWKIDGVAKGALLLMYDCYVTPATGCSEGCTAGDLYNASSPSDSVMGDGYINGARAANMSWGGGQDYGAQPQDIDTFLNDKKDAMVFTSAGNDGVDADNDNIPDERSVTSPANTKNGIALGMCYTANTSTAHNPNARSYSSSVGPVGPAAKPRVKPDLMAPGDDPWGFGSNMGMDSEYSCRSNDNDQVGAVLCEISQGSTGTSFASPAAMGAFALVKDYFAQGFYPDGTSANDNNSDDTMENISGAVVKAILTASADFMTGGNLTKDYRFNYEQGYGRIQLTNVLPLVTDPSTPTGLIIDDQGLDAGTGIGAGSFAQDTFEVTHVNEPLRVVAAWVEGVGEDLINDLDLIVAYDTDEDGTIDSDEPTWWGNYFTEDQLRGTTELTRDGTLETDEDNNGDGTLDSSEWSLKIVDGAKAQKDFLNPNEGVFISVEDLGGGATLTELTGQWIWRLEADSGNPDTQRYAIAIAGGVALGSSIRFDKAPVLCADIVHVTVYEIDDSPPNASQVSSNTTIYVVDPGPDGEFDTTDDVTYDSETGITFTQQGTAYRFLSEDIPITSAGTQVNDNGILDIVDGYRLRAEYTDTSETKTKFSIIGTDCTVKLNKGVTFVQWGRNYVYLIDGGCEVNDLGFSFPDKYMDIDEKLVYWIAIWNGDSDLLDVTVTMDALIPGTTNPSPYVNILIPTKNLGMLNANSTMGVPFEVEITGSPTFPTEVEMRLGLEASKSGKTVKEYQSFTHLINADDEVFHYSTDFPTGGIVTRDYNNDEYVEDISSTPKDKGGQLDAPGEDWDFWYETYKFSDLTDTAHGGGNPSFTGPWNFDDGDDEGFRSGIHPDSTQGALQISNWGEDMNWDNILQPGEDRDPADGTLNQNYAIQSETKAQCGYQTERGIWRTGWTHPNPKQGTSCAGSGAFDKFRCQFYEVRTGTTGADFFFEILKSPEVQKVHINLDTNDYEYYSEFHFMTLQWNQQVDLVDDFVQVTYEVDTNTETDIGVKLDDFTVLGLFNGAMTIREGGSGNQNLLDGFSVFAPSDSLGNETNGTIGNNRVGSRGCYFQSGDGVEPTSPHGLAKPEDDDLDNDSDGTIDEYVTNAGPIRNMDTQKNNGLPASWTLEDLFGDAGTKYQAAFGFFVAEGTADDQPTGGYGIALDDIVLEWDEMHPIQDQVDCSTNGQCASLSVKTLSMYEGNSLVPITILDFNAQTTQGNAPTWNDIDENGDGTREVPDLRDDDSNGRYEIIIQAWSEAEFEGEYFWLEQTSVGSFEYSGVIPISSTYNTEGTIYIKREGTNLPTLTVKYIDKDDGVTAHTYSNGADGKPGVDGVDDDADGTTDEEDERCPLGAGDILRPYGDDICGCPNNPLEIGSSITYTAGRMSIEAVTQVIDNGDDDGFADACETVTVDITLMNLARIGGEFVDLTGVSATIQIVHDADNDGTEDNTVACILDPSAYYGDIPMITSKVNPTSDRFEFQVACDVNRTSIYEEVNAVFDLNVTAGEFNGLYQPLRIVIPLDLDHTGGGSVAAEQFEDFEGGSNKFNFARVDHIDGIRCQYNDPANADGNSFGRANCEIDSGFLANQDWHIHDTTSPDSGRAYDGTNSMHWGVHTNPNDAGGDSLHLQEMHKATLKASEKVFLGMGTPILSFKHQLSMLDSRGSNTPSGEAADRGIVMVAKTDASGAVKCDPNDTDRCWYKVFPYDNVYNAQGTDQFTNCIFDPTDDGSNEDDFFPNTHYWGPSSMCFPKFVWSWMGDTDHESVFDPDNIGAGNGPGLLGSIGPGTWVESKFNLNQFRGYTIIFRFLATTIEVYPAQTYLDAGWPTNIDDDDGWYVDDIRITNRLTSAVTLSDDVAANPGPTCPTDPAQNCDTIYPELDCLADGIDNDQDGSVDEAGEDNCKTLAPGHTFMLSAAESSANKCVDGSLTYRFWLDSDGDGTITDEPDTSILYDWSDRVTYPDNPVEQQHYCVEVRCATDNDCVDYTCVDAGPQPLGPGIVTGLVFDTAKTTISWNVADNGAAYDTIKGDLDVLISTGGNFTTSLPGGSPPDDYKCINPGSPSTSTSVPYTPTVAGQGFYYLVRAENATALNGTYSTQTAKEEAGRDSEIAASGNDCP